jgi:two-component system, OmpR family, response regulator RegX3
MHIAILEDEPLLATHAQEVLTRAQHTSEVFHLAKPLMRALQRNTYDLLVLDWNLPDVSGIKVLRYLREDLQSSLPVLFMTSRQFEQEIVFALESGADEYCTKPLREYEFIARVNALGRRAQLNKPQSTQPIYLDYTFNRLDNTVQWQEGDKSCEVKLPEKEFKLALFLFENAGRSLSRQRIMTEIWGRNDDACSRTLDVHISQVRAHLHLTATSPHLRLKAIHGFGYQIITSNSTTDA